MEKRPCRQAIRWPGEAQESKAAWPPLALLVMDHWEFFHDVASTQTIVRELSGLLDFLSGVPAVKADDGSNPVKDVGLYAEELQKICALSIQHGLPVIFHG